MADFIYQEPFPIENDTTEYRLLTKDYVKVVECDGRRILKVDPKGLELLAKEATTTFRSFCVRRTCRSWRTFSKIPKQPTTISSLLTLCCSTSA